MVIESQPEQSRNERQVKWAAPIIPLNETSASKHNGRLFWGIKIISQISFHGYRSVLSSAEIWAFTKIYRSRKKEMISE
jgi:hypothetical protein